MNLLKVLFFFFYLAKILLSNEPKAEQPCLNFQLILDRVKAKNK